MAKTRVPEPDSEFDDYIRTTTFQLEDGTPNGAVRLGLLPAEATQWIDYRDQWMDLYPKYVNTNTRTKTIKDDKNQLKADFTDFVETPLKRIDVSPNITSGDREVFKIKKRDKTKTLRGIITDIPFGSVDSKGGGLVEVRARRKVDATRSSMHELADEVEFKYLILDFPNPADTGPDEFPTPESCPNSTASKKALWRIDLGYANRGKRVVGFLRWVNKSDLSKSSGWSDVLNTVI